MNFVLMTMLYHGREVSTWEHLNKILGSAAINIKVKVFSMKALTDFTEVNVSERGKNDERPSFFLPDLKVLLLRYSFESVLSWRKFWWWCLNLTDNVKPWNHFNVNVKSWHCTAQFFFREVEEKVFFTCSVVFFFGVGVVFSRFTLRLFLKKRSLS